MNRLGNVPRSDPDQFSCPVCATCVGGLMSSVWPLPELAERRAAREAYERAEKDRRRNDPGALPIGVAQSA
jgi:hypothetical protein